MKKGKHDFLQISVAMVVLRSQFSTFCKRRLIIVLDYQTFSLIY